MFDMSHEERVSLLGDYFLYAVEVPSFCGGWNRIYGISKDCFLSVCFQYAFSTSRKTKQKITSENLFNYVVHLIVIGN